VTPLRVLIADDDVALREVIADVVREDPDCELVAAAGDAEQAVALAALHTPDVAVLDVRMPRGGGVHAVNGIRMLSPQTRIVALSAHGDRETVLQMLQAGAIGYLVKGADPDELVRAIHRAAAGQASLGAEVAGDVVETLTRQLEERRERTAAREVRIKRVQAIIAGDRLATALQPVVDLATGQVAGMEALARFEAEPSQGPAEWFAEADGVGLRNDLELHALRTALRRRAWVPEGAYLAVNASPDTVLHRRIEGLIPPDWCRRIVVELTEHAPVADYDALAAALAPLRRAGVRIAVDDAGAGFASLRHIVKLHPEVIKLDRALTEGIATGWEQRALASALIGFARDIGATIVAEGIETAGELEAWLTLGATYGQGFHLGRPMLWPPAA
jgi:EAL domain-containing protein (putative c-di-GMP-specific phosphodiesterase class I)/CheY-like chemotaxis protein